MRNAPSVLYPVGRCRFYAGALLVLGCLALGVLVSWWWTLLPLRVEGPPGHGAGVSAGAAGAAAWLGWALFAWRSWHRTPQGLLQWDALGAAPLGAGVWRWCSAAHEGGAPLQRVELVLDLQQRALLRLRNPDAMHRWVWVEAGRDPARWSDLRRALRATQA